MDIGIESIAIPCVNSVDAEIPKPFQYRQSVECPQIVMDSAADVVKGCDCSGDDGDVNGDMMCTDGKKCSCIRAMADACYDADGRWIAHNQAVMPRECHSKCGCLGSKCKNRVVQHGIVLPLQVFRTEDKGWGIRCRDAIEQGQFVAEYVGELISMTTAETRLQKQEKSNEMNYILVIREEIASMNRIIRTSMDAKDIGNVSRFFNHSCDPNMDIQLVRTGVIVPRICFFANRNIAAFEELTFSYGEQASVNSKTKCHCKSALCRGFLPHHSGIYPSDTS